MRHCSYYRYIKVYRNEKRSSFKLFTSSFDRSGQSKDLQENEHGNSTLLRIICQNHVHGMNKFPGAPTFSSFVVFVLYFTVV